MKNGSVHVVSTIIRNVISSAAKYEITAVYLNAKYGVIIWNTLEEMGHLHPVSPLKTDNYISEVIVNRSIFQRHSKSMDMCFCWLYNLEKEKSFKFIMNPDHEI